MLTNYQQKLTLAYWTRHDLSFYASGARTVGCHASLPISCSRWIIFSRQIAQHKSMNRTNLRQKFHAKANRIWSTANLSSLIDQFHHSHSPNILLFFLSIAEIVSISDQGSQGIIWGQLKLTLFIEDVQMYLCFNRRWRLVPSVCITAPYIMLSLIVGFVPFKKLTHLSASNKRIKTPTIGSAFKSGLETREISVFMTLIEKQQQTIARNATDAYNAD